MTSLILLADWQKSQIEFWKPIQGFDGYDVSNFGRVRSWYSHPPKILRYGHHRQGYLEVTLYQGHGVRSVKKVHQLVAQAFIKNPEGLREVNHLTALKLDNRADGLEWSTRLLNIQHSFSHGLVSRENGERHPMAILTDAQAKEIFTRVHTGERGIDLAKEFGVSKYVISDIKTRKSWRYQNKGEN